MNFVDIQLAFHFVSSESPSINSAILDKDTGQIFFSSMIADSDELPEGVDDPDRYILIPHKHELDLGQVLVFDFVSEFLPEEMERVQAFFSRKGAYTRFKDLLDYKGLLEKWYEFENNKEEMALKEWCQENGIDITKESNNPL